MAVGGKRLAGALAGDGAQVVIEGRGADLRQANHGNRQHGQEEPTELAAGVLDALWFVPLVGEVSAVALDRVVYGNGVRGVERSQTQVCAVFGLLLRLAEGRPPARAVDLDLTAPALLVGIWTVDAGNEFGHGSALPGDEFAQALGYRRSEGMARRGLARAVDPRERCFIEREPHDGKAPRAAQRARVPFDRDQ